MLGGADLRRASISVHCPEVSAERKTRVPHFSRDNHPLRMPGLPGQLSQSCCAAEARGAGAIPGAVRRRQSRRLKSRKLCTRTPTQPSSAAMVIAPLAVSVQFSSLLAAWRKTSTMRAPLQKHLQLVIPAGEYLQEPRLRVLRNRMPTMDMTNMVRFVIMCVCVP